MKRRNFIKKLSTVFAALAVPTLIPFNKDGQKSLIDLGKPYQKEFNLEGFSFIEFEVPMTTMSLSFKQ